MPNFSIIEELSYDASFARKEHRKLKARLNERHKEIYHSMLDLIESRWGKLFFVFGYGSKRKTYLWRTSVTKIRTNCKIVLLVTSLGIAALLLLRGRTTHSRFELLLELIESFSYQISRGIQLDELLLKTSLIT